MWTSQIYSHSSGWTSWCKFLSYYRPQTKFAKVMFLHLSVILLTGGGGGGVCPSACWDAPPQDQRQTPPHRGQRQAHTTPGAVHAGRYGQQAGGTHPTGMHSCSQKV